MDMINRFDDLDKFINLMKQKIIICSRKWKEEDEYLFDSAKVHLIDEICELFNIVDEKREILMELLINNEFKQDELVDVANMCWICNYLKNEE